MDLSVNRIRKLGFLSVLPDSLVVLDLSGNMLKNLGDLSVLPHLKDLMCEDNFLEELSFLRTCTQLRRLSLAARTRRRCVTTNRYMWGSSAGEYRQ